MEGIEINVTDVSIDVARAAAFVASPAFGANVLFCGTIRDLNHGKRVRAVSYDVFLSLAERVLGDICLEARARWGEDLRFCIIQRVGRIEVGETGVAISVGGRHRDEAYQASRYVIEALKARAPIWKKEHYEDGESEWLEGHALCH